MLSRTRPAPICHLLRTCCPPAITGRVVTVIVDAVDAASGRTFAHVGEKVFERMPAPTDFDAATAVSRKAAHFWVAATLKHASPSNKSSRPLPHASMSMPQIITFALETAARTPTTIGQIVDVRADLRTAIASAAPDHQMSGCAPDNLLRDEATKPLACDILEVGHSGPPVRLRLSSGGRALKPFDRRAQP